MDGAEADHPAAHSGAVYHLAHAADWANAQRSGHYPWSTRGRTIAQEGFLHASDVHQVEGTAQRFYRDDPEPLVLLTIAEERLAAHGIPLVREALVPGHPDSPRFPHLYAGAGLPIDVVVEVRPARFDDEGRFVVGR